MSEICWELRMPDGQIIQGEGQGRPGGMKLATIARDAIASRFVHPAGTVVYCAGPVALVWTIQHMLSAGKRGKEFMRKHGVKPTTKALGLTPACETCRVWIMPNGELGIGRSVEEVGLAWQAFNVPAKA